MISINAPRFELGKVVATPAALELLELLDKNVLDYVSKHVRGDWGDLCDDDAEANENALADGSRIFSSYVLGKGDDEIKIWIITDAEDDNGKREATTVMLPEEY